MTKQKPETVKLAYADKRYTHIGCEAGSAEIVDGIIEIPAADKDKWLAVDGVSEIVETPRTEETTPPAS